MERTTDDPIARKLLAVILEGVEGVEREAEKVGVSAAEIERARRRLKAHVEAITNCLGELMSKRKIDAEELVRRILRFDEDLLRDDYPRDLLDAEIREGGGDPEAIRAEGEAFVKKLLAERIEAESRNASRTRLRSPAKSASSPPPAKTTLSSMPHVRAKQRSDTGPLDDGE